MKKKNNNYSNIATKLTLALLLLATLSMFSCEGFLDKNPLDKMSNETFWTTEEEALMALVGCYARMHNEPYFAINRVMLDVLTDNAQYKWGGDLLSISRGIIEVSTGGIIDNMWSSSYAGISTCNNFLENIDKVEMDEDDKADFKGQVRFLRAFFYFELVQYFGDVIIYETNPATPDDAKIAQAPAEKVLEYIHQDLDSAIVSLSDDDFSEGYAVRGSAQALKLRVLMYEEKWEEAAALGATIMSENTFDLENDYAGLFLYKQDRSDEIMFAVKYLNPNDYHDIDVQLALWGAICPRQEMVDAYECTDGLSISESPLYDPENPYANRDPRLAMTVQTPDDKYYNSDGSVFSQDPSVSGFYQKKYVDTTNLPISSSTHCDQDYILLRYADVLLMYAEAQNEAYGPDQSVYDAIFEVRDRAGMPALPDGLTQDEMREKIRKERRIELALEGLRYFDLKRWKIAHEVMPNVYDYGNVQIVFENPKHYLWPYQQSELEVNPQLVPNPNYSSGL